MRTAKLVGMAVVLVVAGGLLLPTAQGALIAHWTFDNTLANTPNGYPSTGSGGWGYSTTVPWTTGGGASLNVTGAASTWVDVNSGAATVSGTYSVSTWARLTAAGGTRGMFSTRQPTDNGFDMKFQNNNMVHGDVGNGAGGWLSTSVDVNPFNYAINKWYHVTYVVQPNPQQWNIYVHDTSGSLLGSASGTLGAGTPLLFNSTHQMRIGCIQTGELFVGQIDETRVYDHALTQLDAQALAVGPTPPTGNTGPGGFERADIPSSLLYWLRADAGVVESGGVVSGWNDQTSRGNNFAQGTAANQPLLVAGALGGNALPAVRFDGSNDRVTLSTATYPQTVFAVTKVITGGGLRGIWGTDNPSDKGIRLNNTTNYRGPGQNQDGNDFPNSGTPGNIRVNGQVTTAYTVGTPHILTEVRGSSFNATTFNVTQIGGYFGGRYYNGDVGDIIVYDRVLNLAERQIVENYLSARYDVPLAAGDVYSGDTLAKGNYDLDVFGIGRVDAANQVMSAGAAGFGIMAINNSLGNNEWVLAGHKEPTNGLVGGHWGRVWYIGTVGSVDVQMAFDFSDGGMPFPGANSPFAVLFKASEGSSFTQLGVSPTVQGDQVLFNVPSALLQPGYYTLYLIPEPGTMALLGLGVLGLLGRRRRS